MHFPSSPSIYLIYSEGFHLNVATLWPQISQWELHKHKGAQIMQPEPQKGIICLQSLIFHNITMQQHQPINMINCVVTEFSLCVCVCVCAWLKAAVTEGTWVWVWLMVRSWSHSSLPLPAHNMRLHVACVRHRVTPLGERERLWLSPELVGPVIASRHTGYIDGGKSHKCRREQKNATTTHARTKLELLIHTNHSVC